MWKILALLFGTFWSFAVITIMTPVEPGRHALLIAVLNLTVSLFLWEFFGSSKQHEKREGLEDFLLAISEIPELKAKLLEMRHRVPLLQESGFEFLDAEGLPTDVWMDLAEKAKDTHDELQLSEETVKVPLLRFLQKKQKRGTLTKELLELLIDKFDVDPSLLSDECKELLDQVPDRFEQP